MRIQHNIMALNSYRQLGGNNSALAKNLEKPSSGYRINRAGDDAAGLAISEKMRAQIKGLEAAQKNANDGISLVQTAEGALTEVHSMLNRMVYLATQSANGTYDNEVDRANLNKEVQTLKEEIDRIAQGTNFNGINLLDGSMSKANLTTSGVEISTVDMAKGVEITQGTNGGGSKGVYEINVENAFGAGDSLAVSFGGTAAAANTITLNYGAGGIEGDTLEKQAQSIAKLLSANADVSGNFTVEVDGTTVKLTSLEEGNDLAKVGTVTGVVTTNVDAAPDAATWKATAGVKNNDDGSMRIDGIVDVAAGSTGIDFKDGTEVTLEFGDMSLTLVAGKDFQVGNQTGDTLDNLAAALKKATFTDNPDTVIDESQIKFGDMFDVTVDKATGGLVLANKTSYGPQDTDVTIKANGITKTSAEEDALVATGVKKASFALKLAAAPAAQNLAIGDKLTIGGKLADGRTFSFDVEAGKDFKIGANFDTTMANLKDALEKGNGIEIALKDANGKAAGTANSKDIFGDDKEIKFDTTAGAIKFESNKAGTVLTSEVTSVTLTAGPAATATPNLNNGAQQTTANSVINFSEGVEHGAVIEVEGKKYEIVANEDQLSSPKNVAVVVKDPSDVAEVAKAMKAALEENLDPDSFKVSASGGKVTISSADIGSTAKAAEVSSSGDKVKQLEFTLDPKKFQAGSYVEINGKKYEFVEKGGKTTVDGAEKVEIASFEKATAKSLGDALANAANGVNNAQVLTDADGKVTVRGTTNAEGKIVDPAVKFNGSKGGLTLQIGDTSDDFNKMSVSIYNMHCEDMGIGDVDISTIESASAAIDKIRSAINYVSDVRGDLGAVQNRLEHTINNLGVQAENITAAESRIRDTDMAEEMMAYTKNNILVQAAQAMLAQANQVPQGILQLLQ